MDRIAALEHELREEMATSLGRVAEKLEGLIARLHELADEHARAASPKTVAEHAATRAEAELYLWYLVVQREAIGMRDHARVYEQFVIPRRIGAAAPAPAAR